MKINTHDLKTTKLAKKKLQPAANKNKTRYIQKESLIKRKEKESKK